MPHPGLCPERVAQLPSRPGRDRSLAAPPIAPPIAPRVAPRTHLPGAHPVDGLPGVLALFETISRTAALPLAMRVKLVFACRRHHSSTRVHAMCRFVHALPHTDRLRVPSAPFRPDHSSRLHRPPPLDRCQVSPGRPGSDPFGATEVPTIRERRKALQSSDAGVSTLQLVDGRSAGDAIWAKVASVSDLIGRSELKRSDLRRPFRVRDLHATAKARAFDPYSARAARNDGIAAWVRQRSSVAGSRRRCVTKARF